MPSCTNYVENDYCYNCKSTTQRDYIDGWEYDPVTKEYFILAKCHVCEKRFVYVYEEDIPKGVRFPSSMVSGTTKVRLVTVFPKFFESRTIGVPKNALKSYQEGLRCLSIGSPNGAVAMFRKCLQQICVQQGARKGQLLVDQVKILPLDIRPSATELKQWGNLGAHEDSKGIILDVKMNDAILAKEFLERVFYTVYEYPLKIKKSQTRRSGI